MFVLTTSSALLFTSCKKDLEATPESTSTAPTVKPKITLSNSVNPFSLRNVEKAKAALAAGGFIKNQNTSSNLITGSQPQFIYFKFNPNELTGDQFAAIKNDSSVFMLQIPFANMAIYTEEFGLDSTKAEQLRDGNIYGVTPIGNTSVINALTSRSQTQTVLLDTLVKVAEEDTALQFQAFREIGYTEQQLNAFRICLFKRPHGYVRYQDNDLGGLQPVRGMSVWALVFGIPARTYTDDNGYYEIPWRFSFGTVMGTMAVNNKVLIRPLNTTNLARLVIDFLTGPLTIENWFSPCQMRTDIDFNYTSHSKARYWCQILNGYYFHYQYCNSDNITNAPAGMVCYAEWNNKSVVGSASTPLFNYIGGDPELLKLFNKWWSGGISSLSTYFTLLLSHQLPDVTFSVGSASEPAHYSSVLAQTIFHELGHASQFRQVGNAWYASLVAAEALLPRGGGYGTPGYDDWGRVQVAESWAEFIGTQYARRRYGNSGFKNFTQLGLDNLSLLHIDQDEVFNRFWIPTGFYYDLIDNINAEPAENNWDNIGGSSIHNIYGVFNSNTNNMCDYLWQFDNTYPAFFTGNSMFDITNHYSMLDPNSFPCF